MFSAYKLTHPGIWSLWSLYTLYYIFINWRSCIIQWINCSIWLLLVDDSCIQGVVTHNSGWRIPSTQGKTERCPGKHYVKRLCYILNILTYNMTVLCWWISNTYFQVKAILLSCPVLTMQNIRTSGPIIEKGWLETTYSRGAVKAKTMLNYVYSLGNFLNFLKLNFPEAHPNFDILELSIKGWTKTLSKKAKKQTAALSVQQRGIINTQQPRYNAVVGVQMMPQHCKWGSVVGNTCIFLFQFTRCF